MPQPSSNRPGVQPAPRPAWLDGIVQQVRQGRGALLPGGRAPSSDSALSSGSAAASRRPGARSSAVLVLFAPHPGGGCDVVLTERSASLRSHAGQVSFPGGSIDAGDSSPTAAALREAREEVGVDPAGVEVAGELPALYLPPSRFYVTPVLAWWAWPADVRAVDPREVAVVARVPLDELTDPANRFTVTHPSGWTGPAFEAGGFFVWGFTAGVLSALLDLAGLARDWDATRRRPLPERLSRPVAP